jgi:hypothetical protein
MLTSNAAAPANPKDEVPNEDQAHQRVR